MPEDKGLTRAQKEEKILAFWKENNIFKKTLEKKSPKGEFVFYEGPPGANGLPHMGHFETRVFKDAVPRYKTMRGFHVRRQAGWDTHGLPVELEVEKQLGFKSKRDIEKYGIADFNKKCREVVWKYVDVWKKVSDRMGYWLDFDNPYVTYHNSYIESVWSIIAQVEKKKLLYKDYKVLPWCPRCGTALSSHELAQGYQDVKDLSLIVKFKVVGQENTFFLAWTTTPWTLPGNVALAVGKNINYVKVKKDNEILILAEERLKIIEGEHEVIEKVKGSNLVGLKYEPLYPFIEDNGKAFRVYTADFVNTEEGTGIVHTAVMYGQDDFELGTKEGLPKVHLVNPDGTFKPDVGQFAGRSVIDENLSVDILKGLKERGLLFDKENHTHSYPFCWRCKTRLIYYARDSWYIAMSKLRKELVKENEKINWEPEYIKEGRFGEWLREVKDWAVSRERYWGTPLPVWVSEDGERMVVDSVETLKKYTKKSGNKYFVMRHGWSESNKEEKVNSDPQRKIPLTSEGVEQVNKSAQKLKKAKITKIFSSELPRARETAEVVKSTLGTKAEIITDKRLNEINFGNLEWHSRGNYKDFFSGKDRFIDKPEGGESLDDVRRRVGNFLYELEDKYKDENILIVSHGDPLWMMDTAAHGYKKDEAFSIAGTRYLETGESRHLPFTPLPHDENYELDLHKPFIDDVVLVKNGKEFKRVKEVMDVWLDSGAMPFASDPQNILYPADFISEAIDQTRGWFYTLHAVGVLMGRGKAFKNVICLGHILDKEGKKMSKSVGNVIDPWEMIEKYGVDTLRLWMYSVNQPGESKNFDERSVDEIQKRVFNLLDNVYSFYELYRDKSLEDAEKIKSKNVLDQWILSRLSELTDYMTSNLESYKLLEPVRALREFIDDLSTWYLRRSRDRLKEGDQEAKKTLYFVLKTISKLLAPFAPFTAESLYQNLKTNSDSESVHAESWPKLQKFDKKIIKNMNETRKIASLGLEARSKANIKIRQPLASLSVNLGDAYVDLIKDEVNIKVVLDKNIQEVELDTTLTPELIEEGSVRDIVRSIQEMRKEKGLKPKDKMTYVVSPEHKELFEKYGEEIKKTTNIEFSG